ncbi:MAG: Germination protein [Caldanaerobacter subterraneus]|uniref:Ger(X)C family spore germination protein n=1 Tax=Caldanaerobacter subterraneus TaxID=911092 RepID=A0A124FCG4_9THEO|nr:Ger(x)C family spore germination protein [Caldanaerobacter subterraneus]KUK08544.1 MAG: Germination protein [Caldanaerobacter subterraneus]HBT50272.1 Ger(x)C family spore germination protein [Caldanaerobacter subterraneus]
MRGKKVVAMILILLTTLLVTEGCWDKREINQLAFVQGLGIEKGEDGMIHLVVEILKPGLLVSGGGPGGGTGGGSAVGKPYAVFQANGVDFAKAFANLNDELPRSLFMQYNEIIFLDEKFARSGIYQTLDFMTRNPEFRRTTYILVVTGGSIHELFNIPSSSTLERYPYKEVLGIISNQANTSSSYVCDLNEFIQTLEIPKKAPITGKLEIVKKDGKAVGVRLVGSAVFDNDKLIGFLEEQDTKAVTVLMNKLKRSTLTLDKGLKGEKAHISLVITKAKTEIKPVVEGDKISFNIKVNVEAYLNEQETKYDITEPEKLQQLEVIVSSKIKSAIERALNILQKKYNADVVGFVEILHRSKPKVWKKVVKDWENIYPDIKFNVTVKTHIRRSGLSSKAIHPR